MKCGIEHCKRIATVRLAEVDGIGPAMCFIHGQFARLLSEQDGKQGWLIEIEPDA